MKTKRVKKLLASILSASMILTMVAPAAYAEEIIDEVIEEAVEEEAAEEVSGIEEELISDSEKEELGTSEAELMEELADLDGEPEESVSGNSVSGNSVSGNDTGSLVIEINQAFSMHTKKDQKGSESPSYINTFVAGKATAFMVSIKAASEDAATAAVKNWKMTCKEVKDGNEAEKDELTASADNFSIKQYYDADSNVVSGNYMVVANFPQGPDKGKYNFHLYDGDKEIATKNNVSFYETKKLNILAVPVTAYYSKSANVNDDGTAKANGGGCPKDMVGQAVSCENNWSGITNTIATYLKDVYPIADINVEEGQTLDCSAAEYDMCSADGQRKLWEESNKLQVKDKNTGKDKYDLILAFVMYRQDDNGCGQGYTFGKPTNVITLTDADMLPTVAHEIAHCYGVGDEYSGGSYNYRVNNTPLGYTDAGRDKVTGDDVKDSTAYTSNAGISTDDYYWLTSKQYKETKAGATVLGMSKDAIDENGSGSVVYPSLHPYRISTGTFVKFAKNGDTVYPTLSYMGSGYSGNDDYYFTSSVIYDHLFKELLIKEKKPEGEQSNDGVSENSVSENSVSDNDLEFDADDFYFDEEYREGASRMVEVSGYLNYASKKDGAKVTGADVEPMFSYDGDLSYIEFIDSEDDKAINDDDLFIFAAIDKNGNVIKSPVDGEESTVEFYGGNFNPGMSAPAPGSGAVDKRYQDFCAFEFDAEYPQGTEMFVIVNKNDYSADAKYTKTNVIWYRETPDKIIDGEIRKVSASDKNITVRFDACAYDEDDNGTTKGLYTMVYYAPNGDEGDLLFVSDGDYMKDYDKNKKGYATVSFDPSKFGGFNKNSYVWIKVSDGVNGLDLFSDEYSEKAGQPLENDAEAIAKAVKQGEETNVRYQAAGDTLPVAKAGKNYTVSACKVAGDQVITLNAGAKVYIEDLVGAPKTITDSMELTVYGKTYKSGKFIKKFVKVNGKNGQVALKVHKDAPEYKLVIPTEKYKLTINVISLGFDADYKSDAVINGSNSCEINLSEIVGKTALAASNMISAEWFVDGKTAVTTAEKVTTKAGCEAELSADNRTLKISKGSKKGTVKVTAVVNGKKYSTAVKVSM